jgi:type IX secretion system PorP/SprF family membrane protein
MATYAQQRIGYSQYMFNSLVINPAYAGTDKYPNIAVQGRKQWIGVDGSPNSQMVSAHMPLPKRNVGLGIVMEREGLGVTDIYNAYISYAYRIKVGKKSKLSMGIQVGVSTYQERLSDLTLPAGVDDPNFTSSVTYTMPNFGAGLYYYSSRFYAGISVPSIAQNVIPSENPLMANEARHYFLMSGVLIDLSRSLTLKPNFLLKAVSGAPLNLDLNLNLLIQKVLWVGCSYRINNSISPIVEAQLDPRLRVGFSYDVPLTDIRKSSLGTGSPEVLISYRFVKVQPNSLISPRYF